MNCALRPLMVCASVRVTGHKKAGVPATPANRAVPEKVQRNAERLFVRGANYD